MQEQFITERKYFKNVSRATVVWYQESFTAFKGALESRGQVLERIKELREQGLSAVSVNTYLRAINAYFRWMHKEHNKELIKIPRLKEEQKILSTLSTADVERLIKFRPGHSVNLSRCYLVALTILDTGLRASEVTGLTVEAVDIDNLVFRILGKGGKERLVPFSSELRKKLFHLCKHRDVIPERSSVKRFVFGTKNNTKVSVRNLERDFKVLGKKLGITGVRFSPHTLRHSFAIGWLRNGGDIYQLSRILGHSNISTTTLYLKSLGIEDLKTSHTRFSPLSQMHGSVR